MLASPPRNSSFEKRRETRAGSHRLAGGNTEPETLAALERAETAYTIVGATAADQLELALVRAHWHHHAGQHAAALQHLRPVTAASALLGHRTAADAALLHARTLTATGEPARAAELLQQAHHHYTAAGLPHHAHEASQAITGLRRRQDQGSPLPHAL